jgi:hypothetical protein
MNIDEVNAELDKREDWGYVHIDDDLQCITIDGSYTLEEIEEIVRIFKNVAKT